MLPTASHANDLKFSEPQIRVDNNRDKAGELGIDMEEIAFLLSLLTIYLFLVAHFESLRDPLVGLVSRHGIPTLPSGGRGQSLRRG